MGSGHGEGGADTPLKNITVNSDVVLNRVTLLPDKLWGKHKKTISPIENNLHHHCCSATSALLLQNSDICGHKW